MQLNNASSGVYNSHQILINLPSNAVKFTAWGEVILKVSRQKLPENKVKLFFQVIDAGIGIEEEKQTHF